MFQYHVKTCLYGVRADMQRAGSEVSPERTE